MKIPFLSKKQKPKKKKSAVREWRDAIVFAVIAATLIRWLVFEAFTIPTSSMESTLMTGDYLFVSKLHYGARTPKTPLQVPFTHQKIWMTNIPSFVRWPQLPIYRLPGFSEVKRNDMVVFNWPAERQFPTDLKMNYIKRCVGIAGDTIEMRKNELYVNGEKGYVPEQLQFSYLVFTKQFIPEDKWLELDINIRQHNIASIDQIRQQYNATYYNQNTQSYQVDPEVQQMYVGRYGKSLEGKGGFEIHTTPEKAKLIEAWSMVDSVKIDLDTAAPSRGVYPNYPRALPWTRDDWGPMMLPKEGQTITFTPDNMMKYGEVIKYYEGFGEENVVLDSRNMKIFVNGEELKQHTFRQDYYIMMGDNRHNSLDSRSWGFVPADHVVGKAWLIWMSWDDQTNSIRWSRLGNLIHSFQD